MGFNVSCSPGQDAAAAFTRITPQLPALVIYLDPVNMAIQLPPFPGGEQLLAKFCRQLAREATRLADDIDPDEPASASPRHLRRDEGGATGDA